MQASSISNYKGDQQGLNGTVNIGTAKGRYGKVNGGLNLNFRQDKWNVFTNINSGIYKTFNELTLNNIATTNTGVIYQSRRNYWNPTANAGTIKAGVDYSLDKNTTLGFFTNQNLSSSKEPVTNTTTFSDNNKQPYAFVNTIKTDDKYSNNATYNINLKTLLDSLGSELNIDADLATINANGTDINTNYFVNTVRQKLRADYIFRNRVPAKVMIYSAKIDYVKQVNEKAKIAFGVKISRVNMDNNLIADSLQLSTGNWLVDDTRNNQFIYTENLQAAYSNINFRYKKWEFQIGLRAERTSYIANSVTNNTVDKKQYVSLFPSVFATFKINDSHQFNVNFTRRISRPGYSSLNPFLSYIDPFTIFAGNPYLQPAFNYNFEIKHSYKDWLFSNISYRYQTNMRDNVVTQNDNKTITTTIDRNIGKSHYLNGDITIVIPLTKWWSAENNAGINYEKDISTYPGYEYATGNISGYFSCDNTFILSKEYKVQVGFYYSTPAISGYTKLLNSYGGNIGIQNNYGKKRLPLN